MSKQATVLIVEDSPTQAKQIAGLVTQHDVDVVIAEDGPQALRIIDAVQPDLVVLDINLPEMNGFQVCRRLKRDPETAHIPVVMLTSSSSSDEMIKGLEAGAQDYILKDDFAAETLLMTLRSLGVIEEEVG